MSYLEIAATNDAKKAQADAMFKRGDKVKIVRGLFGFEDRYYNIVGEYEYTCNDGMAWVSVKGKGQRFARNICVNPLTMLERVE